MKKTQQIKNIIRSLTLAGVLAGTWLPVQAGALTFDEALRTAQAQSHDLKVMRMEAESAGWERSGARAEFLPRLELSGRHLFDEQFEEIEVPFGGQTVIMPAIQPYSILGVTARWNIFNGFRDWNDFQAARAEDQAAGARLAHAEEQLRTGIRTLFYRALGSQILVDVADQNIKSLESHNENVQVRIRNGVSTRYDSLRVEVQLEDARTEKVAAENSVVIARARLFEALGVPDDHKPLEGQLPEDFVNIDSAKLVLQANSRADRSVLVAEEESAGLRASAARAHWLPSVDLFGNYEWYNNINHSVGESDRRFKNAYAVGVSLSWNLFDGGSEYAEQRKSALNHGIAGEKLAKFDQGMEVNWEEAKNRFQYDVVNYKAKLSSIRKAEEAVRLAKGGLSAGTLTNTDILDAVVDLNRARAAAIKSQIDAIEDLGRLELAAGHSL